MKFPWVRVRRPIYRWDNNWTPFTVALDPVDLPAFPVYIIPDDFYCHLTMIYNEIVTVAGIRSLSPFFLRIYRGSVQLCSTGSWDTVKGTFTNRFTLSRSSLDNVTAANTAGEHYPLAFDLFLIPGDRITFYWAHYLAGDVWQVCNLTFKRWDF